MPDVLRGGRYRDARSDKESCSSSGRFVPSWLRDTRSGKESLCLSHLLREQEEDEQKIREGA